MIEIETTIRNGLPVIARGIYRPAYHAGWWSPSEPEMIEDLEIFWKPRRSTRKLRPCPVEMTNFDAARIEREMLEAHDR